MGRVTPIGAYIAFQERARAVPLSNILITSLFPLAGLPLGAAKVAACARAVTVNRFLKLPPVGVGVAESAIVDASSVTLVVEINVLFVSTSDPASVARVPVVGRVMLEFAEVLSVSVSAPASVKVPPAKVTPVTAPAVRPEAVPVTFVITPDAGVPNAGDVNVGEVRVLLVKVAVESSVTTVPEVEGNVIVVPLVPDNVSVWVTESVFPAVIVKVPVVVVIMRPFIEVAVATPNEGAVNTGDVKVLLVKVCVSVVPTTCTIFVPPMKLARVIFLVTGVDEGESTATKRSSVDMVVKAVSAVISTSLMVVSLLVTSHQTLLLDIVRLHS